FCAARNQTNRAEYAIDARRCAQILRSAWLSAQRLAICEKSGEHAIATNATVSSAAHPIRPRPNRRFSAVRKKTFLFNHAHPGEAKVHAAGEELFAYTGERGRVTSAK